MNNPSRRLAAAFALTLVMPQIAAAMTLGDALKRAAEFDPAVDVALAAYAAESELSEQERGLLRPRLSAEAQGLQNYSDSQFAFGSERGNFSSWAAAVQARQPLLRMDWSARGERADLRDAVADENQANRRSLFVVRISQRYLDVLLAEDRVRQAESEAGAVRKSLDDTRKRFDVELVPGTDLKEAQARDDLAQAQLLSQRSALEDARDALQEVTGYDRSPLPALRGDLSFPPLVPAEAQGWVDSAIRNNSMVRLARMQQALAKADVATRKAEALPEVDLVAEAGHSDSSEFTLGQRQDDARIGVELRVPIYAGGINAARVREAEAREREAEAELDRITLETGRSARTYFRAVETARAESAAFERALESAQLAEKATAAGYDAGTRTIIDVLDAKSRVVAASRSRNESRLNLLSTLLQLNAASGTLTAEMVFGLDPLLFGTP